MSWPPVKEWVVWECPTCGAETEAPSPEVITGVLCMLVDKHSDGNDRVMKPKDTNG